VVGVGVELVTEVEVEVELSDEAVEVVDVVVAAVVVVEEVVEPTQYGPSVHLDIVVVLIVDEFVMIEVLDGVLVVVAVVLVCIVGA